MVQRNLAAKAKPDVTITKDASGEWVIATTTSFHNSSFKFKLGEPFMNDTLEGRKAMVNIYKFNHLSLEID